MPAQHSLHGILIVNDFVIGSHAFCVSGRESAVASSDHCSGPSICYASYQGVSYCDWLTVTDCLYAYRERHSVIVTVTLDGDV